jgi:hypothetical protein
VLYFEEVVVRKQVMKNKQKRKRDGSYSTSVHRHATACCSAVFMFIEETINASIFEAKVVKMVSWRVSQREKEREGTPTTR